MALATAWCCRPWCALELFKSCGRGSSFENLARACGRPPFPLGVGGCLVGLCHRGIRLRLVLLGLCCGAWHCSTSERAAAPGVQWRRGAPAAAARPPPASRSKKKTRPPSSRCYTPCILWQHCFGRCLCQGASWGAHLELLGGRLLARTHGGFFLGRHDSVREMLTEVVSKIFSLDAHSARVLAPCNCPRVETGGSHALATSQRWFVRRELSISLSEVLAAPPPLRQRAPPPLSAFASSSGPCWARVIICRAGVGRGSFCACACITGRLHRAVPGQLMPPPADPLLRCSSAACYRLLVFNATGRIICCISEAAAGEREQQSRGESGRSGAAEQSDKQTRAGAGAGTRPDQTRAGGGASLRSGPCACDPCTWSLA